MAKARNTEKRYCKKCGRSLSLSNPNKICFSHFQVELFGRPKPKVFGIDGRTWTRPKKSLPD